MKFASSSLDLLKFLFIYFVLDFILRIYELYLLYPYFSDFKALLSKELNGFYHDIFKFSTLLFIFFAIYFTFSLWSRKMIRVVTSLLLFLFILLSFLTIQYYVVSFVPLDKSVYSYTFNDIIKIFFASGDISLISYIVLAFIVILFFVLAKSIKLKSYIWVYFIWFIWIVTMPNISYSHVKAKFFASPQDYYLVKNKAIYFLEQSAKYFSNNNEQNDDFSIKKLNKIAKKYASLYPQNKYFLSSYPLLRKRDDPDVLGKYFKLKDTIPNIVFIILESMGRNICGPNARFGSFTPFLDSLINHSLYWENFLSNADRTFGAIPNILGSLPFGDKSFHDHKQKPFPLHKTIISHLKNNGFRTSFYYGGWTHFNNMDDVLKASNIDFILSEFDNDAKKIKSDAEDFSWGYDDKSLFTQYLKTINSDSVKNTKRLDILLTLSLHSPFSPPRNEYYLNKFQKITNDWSESRRKLIKPYTKPLTTVLYVDDALRYLFGELKKRKDFKNTIFILTGDHNLHAMPDDNEIRQFQIPLIIYSPLLADSAKFNSISSHQDIYPSILSLLSHKYNIKLPKVTHSISNGLFASKEFRQNKLIPFFQGRNLNTSILDNGYFFSQDKCYKLNEGMNLEPIENDSIIRLMKWKLQIIKDVNKYVYNKDKIIPYKYK